MPLDFPYKISWTNFHKLSSVSIFFIPVNENSHKKYKIPCLEMTGKIICCVGDHLYQADDLAGQGQEVVTTSALQI